MKSKAIAETLGSSGICVCPDFLSSRALQQTADDLDAIHAQGFFHPAGVGQGATHLNSKRVRNDNTYWLDRETTNSVQNLLWRKIDLLKRALNRSLFLGLTEFEGHYAVYPEGGFYHRHKDSFRSDQTRVVSFILYLNRAWQPLDGGRLRVYATGDDGKDAHQDVDPVGGTLVCFLSREIEHEVLLSLRQRFSLSGWYKVAPTF